MSHAILPDIAWLLENTCPGQADPTEVLAAWRRVLTALGLDPTEIETQLEQADESWG